MPRSRACNRPNCDVEIVIVTREDTRHPVVLDADPVDVDRLHSTTGLYVLVGEFAWKPEVLAPHFQGRFEIPTLDGARELVRQYPHHRPHFDLPTSNEGEQP